MITFLFEYIRLDSDSFSLKKENCNLSELLRKCAATLYADVEEKGMEFQILIPEEAYIIELDAMQVSRVIANLITNAIKHNETGTEITLEMKVAQDKIQVLVSDKGTPISPLMSENIFEPFVMGDASRQSESGSGLGLSIAKKIVEMHGWKLKLYQNNAPYVKSFVVEITY
ncbi:MAG: HAMP domain-containing histidine kinase [Lachnospiraceae bacterium]|nr:HAMP domain-containing histidine kinase [Lachnospiraceae bacterium]